MSEHLLLLFGLIKPLSNSLWGFVPDMSIRRIKSYRILCPTFESCSLLRSLLIVSISLKSWVIDLRGARILSLNWCMSALGCLLIFCPICVPLKSPSPLRCSLKLLMLLSDWVVSFSRIVVRIYLVIFHYHLIVKMVWSSYLSFNCSNWHLSSTNLSYRIMYLRVSRGCSLWSESSSIVVELSWVITSSMFLNIRIHCLVLFKFTNVIFKLFFILIWIIYRCCSSVLPIQVDRFNHISSCCCRFRRLWYPRTCSIWSLIPLEKRTPIK